MTTAGRIRPSNRSPSGTWDDRGARGRHRRDTCAQATALRRYKCAPPAPRHDEHAPVRAVDAPLHPNAGKPEARRGLPRGVRAVRPHGRGGRTSRQGSGIRQTVCRQRRTGQSPVIRLYTDNQARPEARSRGDACVALEVGRARPAVPGGAGVAPAHQSVERNDRSRQRIRRTAPDDGRRLGRGENRQEARPNRAYEVQAGGPTGNGSVLG